VRGDQASLKPKFRSDRRSSRLTPDGVTYLSQGSHGDPGKETNPQSDPEAGRGIKPFNGATRSGSITMHAEAQP
jgi:hypothetical protein